MAGQGTKVKIGLFHDSLDGGNSDQVRPLVDKALANGFHFAIAPLLTDIDPKPSGAEVDVSFVDDFELSSSDWRSRTQGLLLWSNEEGSRVEMLLERQLGYASQIGVSLLYLDLGPHSEPVDLARLSRVLNSHLQPTWGSNSGTPEIRLILPIDNVGGSVAEIPNGLSNGHSNGSDSPSASASTTLTSWEKAALIRDVAHPDARIAIALVLTGDLPDEDDLKLWFGERVSALILPTSSFINNDHGFPVLPVAFQRFIRQCIFHQAQRLDLIIQPDSGESSGGGNETARALHLYYQYLDHMRSQIHLDENLEYIRGYEDVLQIPLQPLKDNLDSSTYAVFEHDAIKYLTYQDAIHQALKDKAKASSHDSTFVLMVLGAGRGPLVTASIRAAESTAVQVKIVIVEKNPYALVHLAHLKKTKDEWKNSDIHIHGCDMRDLHTDLKADIVISELLGSLGDNELSPECLANIGLYMKADGVCIPQRYRSYLQPIMSHRLFSETILTGARPLNSLQHSAATLSSSHAYTTDSGYVACLRNFYPIDEPQVLFTFEHLDPAAPENVFTADKSRRFQSLTFTASRQCTLHGLGGYFDTTLYGTASLSTLPGAHTPGMHSWFPYWIPLREKLSLKAGERITVNFWRLRDARQVWYEWCLTEPTATRIQNCNGLTSSISLF